MAKQVTRSMADEAAKQLASQVFDKKIELAEQAERQFGDELIKKYIPAPILAVGVEYSSYFINKSKYLGFATSFGGQIQSNIVNPISNKYIQIEMEDYKHAKVLIDKRKKLQQNKGDYMSKVSDALLQLKSFKRIKENFPEALPFLNFAETTALIPQFTELRSLLNN